MKTQKERLMKFIAYTEMSKSAFERAAGLSASSLIHAGDDLTADFIVAHKCQKCATFLITAPIVVRRRKNVLDAIVISRGKTPVV